MTTVRVYPLLGLTALAENGETITAAGALVAVSDYYRKALREGWLLTTDPTGSASAPLEYANSSVAGYSTANVRQFGALGNDDQTLHNYSYTSDIAHTQQTADGIAFCRAISYLRSLGGGMLYVPKGVYRVYGFLESLDFNIRIVGDGPGVTVIRTNGNAPASAHGYGIIRTGPPLISTINGELFSVSLENMTLDGNAQTREEPDGEYRSSVLAVQGVPQVRLVNMEVINSSCDCLLTNYLDASYQFIVPGVNLSAAAYSSLYAVNCTFSNAFRNTISLVAGWRMSFTNCDVLKGGKVHGGINPAVCLDIEPDASSISVRGVTFTNCRFRDSYNELVSVNWSQARFVGCEFVSENMINPLHIMCYTYDSQVEYIGCSFKDTEQYIGYVYHPVNYNTGDFAKTQFLVLKDCQFEGCGLISNGRSIVVENCDFLNSKVPVLFISSPGVMESIRVRNVRLVNIVDTTNRGTGAFAGFAINSNVDAEYIDIDGVVVEFAPDRIPAGLSLTGAFTTTYVWGASIYPTVPATGYCKINNIHVAGYYRKYPTTYGYALNVTKYRDWGINVTPPADTAGSTTTPGAAYYRGCTMYGDFA